MGKTALVREIHQLYAVGDVLQFTDKIFPTIAESILKTLLVYKQTVDKEVNSTLHAFILRKDLKLLLFCIFIFYHS
jgi:hypothetical protein